MSMQELFAEWSKFTAPVVSKDEPEHAYYDARRGLWRSTRKPRGNVHNRVVRPDGFYYRVKQDDIVVKPDGTIRRTLNLPDGHGDWEAREAVIWGASIRAIARASGLCFSKVANALEDRTAFAARRDY